MAETAIVIHDYKVHPHTGRIEVHLKCRTVDGTASWEGPIMAYSADPQMLRDRFNGDLARFEAWAANEHKHNVGVPPGLPETLDKRKGTVIG